jgi:hypothetical protein
MVVRDFTTFPDQVLEFCLRDIQLLLLLPFWREHPGNEQMLHSIEVHLPILLELLLRSHPAHWGGSAVSFAIACSSSSVT